MGDIERLTSQETTINTKNLDTINFQNALKLKHILAIA
jgi:hypothetical protein